MANGSSSGPPPNSYGGFGGLGQPGVRETKVVGETSEIKIPRKQFLETWIFTFLLMILGYACLKLIIVSRADWSLLVGVLTIPALFAIYLFVERQIAYRFFPNIYAECIEALKRMVSTNDIGRFILFALTVSVVCLVSIGFYISVIVPQITLILDQQAQYLFVFAAFVSLLFAFIPYYRFNKRQLTDSLRDSDSAYARESLRLEYESRWRKEEARRMLVEAPASDGEVRSEMIQAIPLIKASSPPTAPITDAQLRFKEALLDFLDGIDEGKWSTNERSWRNDINGRKILAKSHFSLMEIGSMIREELINGRWARWKNQDDHQRGWELLYSTQEIRNGAFRYGDTANPADDKIGEDGEDGGETIPFVDRNVLS